MVAYSSRTRYDQGSLYARARARCGSACPPPEISCSVCWCRTPAAAPSRPRRIRPRDSTDTSRDAPSDSARRWKFTPDNPEFGFLPRLHCGRNYCVTLQGLKTRSREGLKSFVAVMCVRSSWHSLDTSLSWRGLLSGTQRGKRLSFRLERQLRSSRHQTKSSQVNGV